MKEDIDGLRDSDAESHSEQIERLARTRQKKMNKRSNRKAKKTLLENENALYEQSISDFEDGDTNNSRTKALRDSCEFWFSYSNKRLFAMEHPANKISIKLKSNSSIGNHWPYNYLQSLLEHENRISKQFMKLDDMSLFTQERFSEFIKKRTEWQHRGLTQFLDTLLQGNWGDQQPEPPVTDQELLTQDVEIGLERKETVYFDTKREMSTWEICSSGGRPVHYLRADIVRAIIAFGNSGGGHVLVGVADNGTVVGLDRDIEVLQNKYVCSKPEAKDRITTSISDEISILAKGFNDLLNKVGFSTTISPSLK